MRRFATVLLVAVLALDFVVLYSAWFVPDSHISRWWTPLYVVLIAFMLRNYVGMRRALRRQPVYTYTSEEWGTAVADITLGMPYEVMPGSWQAAIDRGETPLMFTGLELPPQSGVEAEGRIESGRNGQIRFRAVRLRRFLPPKRSEWSGWFDMDDCPIALSWDAFDFNGKGVRA